MQTTALSTSFLLLMVFLTTETLKRFPLDHPFSSGAADPALLPVRLALLAGYAAGLGYQLWGIHAARVLEARFRRVFDLAA